MITNPKVGDRVKLSKGSGYYNTQGFDNKGNQRLGKIVSIHPIRINFDDDYSNVYADTDVDRINDYIEDWVDAK